jgi:pimeloyl-ACP methyl ester carboxylesterase
MKQKITLGQKILYGAIIVTGLYVVLFAGLTLAQRRLLYYPCRRSIASSEKLAAGAGSQIWRNTAGQFIGWKRMSQRTPAQGQVLILHGNSGCAVDRMQYADGLQSVAALDVYILEYPGYAGRGGSPSQRSLFAAGTEAMQQLGGECRVYLIGESLGTGVAAYLAGTHPQEISGVFLISPYNNLTAVARHHLPIFPVKLMLWDKYSSDLYLKAYHGPLGVLLAGKDQVVPTDFGRQLFEGYEGPKKLWEFFEAGHHDVSVPKPEIWKEVLGFLNKNLVLARSSMP